MSEKKPLTRKQRERQHPRHRSEGRYAKVNPCYVCGKSTGVDGYFSDSRTDNGLGDEGLVLCEKCCNKGEAMALEDARKFYLGGVRWT